MAAKRKANPHTNYGRRRIFREAKQFNKTLSSKQLQEGKNMAFLFIFLAFLIVAIIVLCFGGIDGLKTWLTPKGL